MEFDSTTHVMHNITVPTPEVCALQFWTGRILAVGTHCMLVGKTGVGKSQIFKVCVYVL